MLVMTQYSLHPHNTPAEAVADRLAQYRACIDFVDAQRPSATSDYLNTLMTFRARVAALDLELRAALHTVNDPAATDADHNEAFEMVWGHDSDY